MNKTTAGAALAAAIGISALGAAPATAAHIPFPDCTAAAEVGVYNIPETSPAYAPRLDQDRDGFGCDQSTIPYDDARVQQILAEHDVPPAVVPDVVVVPPAVVQPPADVVLPPPTAPDFTDVMVEVEQPPAVPLPEAPQIAQMPVGAVDAGVSVNESTNTGVLALAGGLALAGAAGATVIVRRRNAEA